MLPCVVRTGHLSSDIPSFAPGHLLDEPVELLPDVRAAEVRGPGVADGELVELQHVHDPDLSHGAAEQLGTLVHAGR